VVVIHIHKLLDNMAVVVIVSNKICGAHLLPNLATSIATRERLSNKIRLCV
jgi:hypothetical protein